ncbi:hypothetical protein N7456_011890 [Penicillium angulare]|uniref:Uncharacterized protein n=1 Tax=Penicillium angulare TaxID=116970 RepID=A0A9W9K054_9EURO|nr:hypothetical protein N7456_011890 [Penicillium angulare]
MTDRTLIVGQISEVITNFLKGYDSSSIPPIRIVGDTPNSILDQENCLQSITPIVEEVKNTIATCRPETTTRWVAAAKFPGRRSFFVLDLNNTEYDYDSAHLCREIIPVHILRLSRAPKVFRHQGQDQKIADTLAQMHNNHGQAPLPLFDDHTKHRCYAYPRTLYSVPNKSA